MSRFAVVGSLLCFMLVVGTPHPWEAVSQAAQKETKAPPAKTPAAKNPGPKTQPKNEAKSKSDGEPIPLGSESPLELVRGLREDGMADLALQYLEEIKGRPLPPEVSNLLPLERAKCLLDAASDESDEGTRTSLVGEAKDGFNAFLKNNADHPRAAEAYLALARLTSLEAKAQLSKARRAEVPAEEGPAREEALLKQQSEAAAARPLFIAAADQFQAAAARIEKQIQQPNLDPVLRRTLAQARYDAELANGINHFSLGDTYINASAAELKDRLTAVDKAKEIFSKLANDEKTPPRIAWVARAWMAECEHEKQQFKIAEEEFAKILRAGGQDVEEGKRMVQFFQVRHRFIKGISDKSLPEIQATERMARTWLDRYGSLRRAQGEAVAVRWYRAYCLQVQGDNLLPPPPKVPPKTPAPQRIPAAARPYYVQAEKLYRVISQSENEYSSRAAKQRMIVVRRLLGEADRPPSEYETFEEAQMASLIQMSKLSEEQAEAPPGDDKAVEKIKKRQQAIVALLERARNLATDADSKADVTEVLIRLIYFYQVSGQPYRAAVLAEHVARNMKTAGGKSSVAGALGFDSYMSAAGQIRATDQGMLESARRADRDHAIELARFLDEKFPTDTATDRARHRLAGLLWSDGKLVETYDTLLKVRAGYEEIGSVRLFQGALAQQLLGLKDSPLADDRRTEVFRRTTSDLEKIAKPLPEAPEEDVRIYLTARNRLALLYLLQPRVDPAAEKSGPGYVKSRKTAEDVLGSLPTFVSMVKEDGGTKAPNVDGWEMKLMAEDARTRAVFLEGQALFVKGKYDEAYNAIGQVLAEMNQNGTYSEALKKFFDGVPTPAAKAPAPPKKGTDPKKPDPKKATTPPKTPEPKKAAPPPKKGPEPKKGLAGDFEPIAAEAAAPEVDDDTRNKLIGLADTVDRIRRDMIVLALKIRVKQGQAEKGAEQLELLKRFGGSLDANVATLQQLTTEMAGQILALKRAGKAAEARALTEGFGKLLDKVAVEPKLPPSILLFLGQSLVLVGEFEKAEQMLTKVPKPAAEVLLKPVGELKDPERTQVLLYRRAALELVRAYRNAKKYNEADALLKDSMGTADKQNWAFASLEFRKEMAYLAEDRGAAEPNVQEANKLWGQAVQEWALQYNLARKRLSADPPKTAEGNIDNAAILRNKNAFFEAYFEYHRCIVKANMQLRKGSPKLQATFDDLGRKFFDMEKSAGEDMVPEVREKYTDLLEEIPELKKAYEAAGGKMFLERPAAADPGVM
jgi:hypothetical protein